MLVQTQHHDLRSRPSSGGLSGRRDPRRPCRDRRHPHPDLPGARSPRQATGRGPPGIRRRPRYRRRDLSGALGCLRRRRPGRAAGRRRLPAARSGHAGRAAGVHVPGRRAPRDHYRRAGRRSPAVGRVAAARRPRSDGAADHARRASRRPQAGAPGLRHLHVRLDRAAEGRRDHSRQPREPRGVAPPRLRRHRGRSRAALREPRLRCGGVGDLAVPRLGRQRAPSARCGAHGSRGTARLAGGPRHHDRLRSDSCRRAAHRAAVADVDRGADAPDRRRHAASLSARRTPVRARQQLRPDRVHGGHDVRARRARAVRRDAADDRSPDRQRRRADPRRGDAAGRPRRGGRALHRRRGARPRLPRPPGSHRRAVRAAPRRAGRAPVPHGGSCAAARRRARGVPGPRR